MTRIAIGLPTRHAAGDPDLLLAWMRAADAGPFSSLAVTDRVVTDALEPLSVLATAAGATRRIGLLASVVIGPTRETSLLGRQAATIDALSGGRLTLGLGVGAREDDYGATGTAFHARGRAFDAQLPALRRMWQGGAGPHTADAIGPAPHAAGGPRLLIGGYVAAVVRRVVAWGDGWMAPGGGTPEMIATRWAEITRAWAEAGRPGAPRLVMGGYYALGPRADEAVGRYVAEAYSHDPVLAERRRRGVPTTPDGIRGLRELAGGLGADELILRPCAAGLDQLERLAALVG